MRVLRYIEALYIFAELSNSRTSQEFGKVEEGLHFEKEGILWIKTSMRG